MEMFSFALPRNGINWEAMSRIVAAPNEAGKSDLAINHESRQVVQSVIDPANCVIHPQPALATALAFSLARFAFCPFLAKLR